MTASQTDEDAAQEFAQLAAMHRPQIFRFLLSSLRDVDLAETLTQDCLLKAHKNWKSFQGNSSAMTWLLRIAINLQKDHWRSRRLKFWRQSLTVNVDEIRGWLRSEESSPEDQVRVKEQMQLVWKTVEKFSERQRTIFLLRHVEQFEFDEIAQMTGLNVSTVKVHLTRAMSRLRSELGGRR